MSIKKVVRLIIATLTVVAGMSALAPLSASAATPACGPNCLSVAAGNTAPL